MLKRCISPAIAAILCFAGPGGPVAQSANGTASEAKAMLERAVTSMKANKTSALAEFNNAHGAFRDRDLYVFCVDLGGRLTAHADRSLIGAPTTEFVDLKGKRFGLEILNAAAEGKIAEIAYTFPKIGTYVSVEKVSFVTKVADQICGVGYYK
jgi:hypothetical protein